MKFLKIINLYETIVKSLELDNCQNELFGVWTLQNAQKLSLKNELMSLTIISVYQQVYCKTKNSSNCHMETYLSGGDLCIVRIETKESKTNSLDIAGEKMSTENAVGNNFFGLKQNVNFYWTD